MMAIRMVSGKPGNGMKLQSVRYRCGLCGRFVAEYHFCCYCLIPGRREQ